MSTIGIIIIAYVTIGYPIYMLKIPQKDNPFYYRKKYATSGTIQQF